MLCGDHFKRQDLQIKESAPIHKWPYLVNTTHFLCLIFWTIFASMATATKLANLIKNPFSILDELDWSIVILQQNRHFQSNKWPSGVFCISELFSETALFMQISYVFSLASLQIYHFPRHTPVQLAPPPLPDPRYPSRTPDIPPTLLSMGAAKFLLNVSLATTFPAGTDLLPVLGCHANPPARRHDGDKLWTESSQSTPKPSFQLVIFHKEVSKDICASPTSFCWHETVTRHESQISFKKDIELNTCQVCQIYE